MSMVQMLGVSVVQYVWQTGQRAVFVGVTSFLFLHRVSATETWCVMINIQAGGLCHGAPVSILYCRFVLTDPLRNKIRSKFQFAHRD
jgi:hypothetical protein